MKKINKDTVTAVGFVAVLALVLLLNIVLPDKAVSDAERRKLDQLPELSADSVLEGDYFEKLEDYAMDQFLLRDAFRTVKSAVRLGVFMQLESNDLYFVDDGIYKLSPELNENAVKANCEKLITTAQNVLPESSIYYTVIPEKNTFVDSGVYPEFDRERMEQIVAETLVGAQRIEITDLLSADDYYLTDPHWRQECITDVADRILGAMGSPINDPNEFEQRKMADFYGTYRGQLPLGGAKDELYCLTSDRISGASVFNYETGKTGSVYNEAKLEAMDPYDYFLDGACALLRIENPEGASGKELVIFRDSFGSSIAPLLISDYSAVTLVDLRYMSSSVLEQYIAPTEHTDVLIIYCETLLNNSGVLR